MTLETRPPAADRTSTPLALAAEFGVLFLFGPLGMVLAALARVIGGALLVEPRGTALSRHMLRDGTAAVAATTAAALTYGGLGAAMDGVGWPWRALPIAVAVLAYGVVERAVVDVVLPFLTRRPSRGAWPSRALPFAPGYFLGASVATALAEIVNRRAWHILPVAAVPLYLAFHAYRASAQRSEEARRLRDTIDALDQGVCVLDRAGCVTLWNDALARMLTCPRERALGSPLVQAVPVLGETPIPGSVRDALESRCPRMLPHVTLTSASDARVLRVEIRPEIDRLTLLWRDVTEQAHAVAALGRSVERFALAAEGANDGLWEWDVRSQEFFGSTRWKTLLGLPSRAQITRVEQWLERVHPEDVASLKMALDAHLSDRTDPLEHEHRIRHEDGTYRHVFCRGVALLGDGRQPARIAGSLTDVTARANAQELINSTASRDPLTGLSNRTVFIERLGEALAAYKRNHDGHFAALYLDLDRFKLVNDSLGHLVGDELLTAVSRRLESCLRPGDALARLGGDEFAVLLTGLSDVMQANTIALRIHDRLSVPFTIGGRAVFTSASIGIAFCRAAYTSAEEIVRDADAAMYHAKARGGARHELFDAEMHARALDRLCLESDLRHAVKNSTFEIHYQPIVSLATGMCTGFEALVRWKRNGKAVSPAQFIPIAEELGLIESLGAWVIQEACSTFANWQRQFPVPGLDCITVNVSTRQLMQQGFAYLVEQAVYAARMTPGELRLEITETALMDSPNLAAQVLKDLRDFGVKIYLDDFGTGYSSLSHLHKLPVDALKIDRSFVTSLLLDDRPAIVESILALARTLDTSVVAEGVENELQANELERLGCRQAQGYFFSPPLSAADAEKLLAAREPLGGNRPRRSDQIREGSFDPGQETVVMAPRSRRM